MEATALSVGKSALNGALNYANSAIAQEVALQLGVQRDQAFIKDELEMMLSFLMAAHEERDNHKVVQTWVKQVRDVAYDVEDCLQDQVVRLGKPSRWCFIQTLVNRHRIATQMKELRAKVEDISQRNVRYRLIKDTNGPKSGTGVWPSSIAGATVFGIEEARRHKDKPKVDLTLLINEGNDDLRVIAVWGTNGVLGQSILIKGAYDDVKRSGKFELYAWIRIMHPFNPLEFLHSIMRQFYSTSLQQARKTQEKANIGAQVLNKMEMMKQADLVNAFCEHVNEKSYMIVLNDLSTIEEWDTIKEYFPDNKKGSRIIVSTEHGEVASLCAGQQCIVSELSQPSVDQSIFASHNMASQNQTALMEPASRSGETTLATTNSRMPDEIVESQFVGDNGRIAKKSLSHLGTIACTMDESQLVGREKEKSELINLISKQGDQQSMVISVWGMGGLGKTTLVKEAYQSQELSGLFEKRACVTIMHPFVLNEVLKSLAMQLCGESFNRKYNIDIGLGTTIVTDTKLLAEELGKVTEKKRCLIVLDDLSSIAEWNMIIQSLPTMENSSRIVITTREENIAKHCSAKKESIYKLHVLGHRDALDLFTKKVFNKEAINLDEHPTLIKEAKTIMKKCNGLPLAIVTIGSFLAKQPKTPNAWKKMNEHISAELELNPELETIRIILMKSYDGLPYHLKSCFLYLSIFPEDYNISRRRLLRRWIAEGYSSEVRGKSMGEIADDYFVELIERSMVLPSMESIGSRKGISSCKLHDLMREISISKSMEENLVFRMEEGCSLNNQGTIRHLSISSNWKGDQNDFECTVDLSRIRSLTVFGKWKPFYISDKMKLLRVLDLEGTSDLEDHHLLQIGKLLHLKYLSLRGCWSIGHLPESTGNLKQLQTIDVTDTWIMRLPQAITKLRKLQYIRAGVPSSAGRVILSNESVCLRALQCCCLCCCYLISEGAVVGVLNGVAVPRELRKLKALQTLGLVNIARGKAILWEIRGLTRLRKLAVTGIHKENCQEFSSTLAHLSSLESLLVHSAEEVLRECLDSLPTPPKKLQSLKLNGTLGKLPKWATGLQNLVKLKLECTKLTEVDGTMQVLGKLPNLTILRLLDYSFEADEPRHLSCSRDAFPSLTVLELAYPEIESVKFEEGAAPKLELLLCQASITFSGLSSLLNLKEVTIKDKSDCHVLLKKKADCHAKWVENLRTQLASNQNKPIVKIVS